MPLDTSIKNKVQEFILRNEMFTSVDISNAIKSEGIWIKNREVAEWLRTNFSDASIFGDYARTSILVCNGATEASLYHPHMSDIAKYANREQRTLTPDDVKIIQTKVAGTLRPDSTPDINDILDPAKNNSSDIVKSLIIKSKDRVKVPGDMIRALGWKPGDRIDPAVIKTHRALTKPLFVNSDYRVSIPRICINWGVDPVKVILRRGVIEFEKA